MPRVQEELVECGRRLVASGLTAGSGGSVSARDSQQTIWMKPTGLALDELRVEDLCGIHISTGRQTSGRLRPTSEAALHVAAYQRRPDAAAVLHVHPPWLSGVITAGVSFRPMTCETVFRLGRIATIPYVMPTAPELVKLVAEAAAEHDIVLMPHNGMLSIGENVRQALCRCQVAEHAAKTMVAAAAVGTPAFLTDEQIAELEALRWTEC